MCSGKQTCFKWEPCVKRTCSGKVIKMSPLIIEVPLKFVLYILCFRVNELQKDLQSEKTKAREMAVKLQALEKELTAANALLITMRYATHYVPECF